MNVDFDTWGPIEHAVNRLSKTDAFYARLFSTYTDASKDFHLSDENRRALIEELTAAVRYSEESMTAPDDDTVGKTKSMFTKLKDLNTEADFSRLAQELDLTQATADQ